MTSLTIISERLLGFLSSGKNLYDFMIHIKTVIKKQELEIA
jgi:hypothetical protein